MRYLLTLLSVAALSICSACSHAPEVRFAEPSALQQEHVIPISLDKDTLAIEMSIQGKIRRLMLDTGGGDAVTLTEDAMDGINATKVGSSTYSDAFGKRISRDLMQAKDIQLGSLKIASAEILVLKDEALTAALRQRSASRPFDGWLGREILERFDYVIDAREGELRLLPPGNAAHQGIKGSTSNVPIFRRHGIVTDMTIDGKAARMLWDTGATMNVVKPTLAPGQELDLGPSQHEFRKASSLTLGGFELLGHTDECNNVALLDFSQPPGVDGFIGMNIFRHYTVTVSVTDKRIWVTR